MHFSRNIVILFILRAVRWFLLMMPIIAIFYSEHGLNNQDIFIIQSCFAFAVVIFEIPTGYFSDVLGRKKSIIVGMLLGAFGLGLYALTLGFWGFLIAELVLGLGSSFISGTDSAMAYDTLFDEGKVTSNKKIQSYLQTISSASEAFASFLGGFLAVISINLPIYIQFSVYVLAIPLAFLLKEPKQEKHDNKDGILRGIARIVKYSLHEHREIKWLIFFSGAFGASTLVMTWLLQQYFTHIGVPLVYFGVLWSIFTISLVPFSFFAHQIEVFFGRKWSLFLLALLPIFGYLCLSIFDSFIGLIFVFSFYFARGFGSVVLNDYVNILISSQIRATVLSVQALMFRLVFIFVGPIVGWISDTYSISMALFSAAIIFAILFAITIFFLSWHRVLDS